MGAANPVPDKQPVIEDQEERMRVVVCVNRMRGPRGKCCGLSGSLEIAEALESGARTRGLNVAIERIVCLGKCDDGPNLRIVGGEFRQNLTLDDVPSLLEEFEKRSGRIDGSTLLYPGA